MQGKEITLSSIKSCISSPKTPAPKANSPSSPPSDWDGLTPLHPSPLLPVTLCGCSRPWALTSEQTCPLSQQPTGSGTQSPAPRPHGRGHRAGIVSTTSGRNQKLTLSTNQDQYGERAKAQSRRTLGRRREGPPSFRSQNQTRPPPRLGSEPPTRRRAGVVTRSSDAGSCSCSHGCQPHRAQRRENQDSHTRLVQLGDLQALPQVPHL